MMTLLWDVGLKGKTGSRNCNLSRVIGWHGMQRENVDGKDSLPFDSSPRSWLDLNLISTMYKLYNTIAAFEIREWKWDRHRPICFFYLYRRSIPHFIKLALPSHWYIMYISFIIWIHFLDFHYSSWSTWSIHELLLPSTQTPEQCAQKLEPKSSADTNTPSTHVIVLIPIFYFLYAHFT